MSESSSASLQGVLELLILKTLQRSPNYGFGIALHVHTLSDGLLRVKEGSLYPALLRLERDKRVLAEWRVSANGRRACYYSLTSAGRKRLSEVEEAWESLAKGVAKMLQVVDSEGTLPMAGSQSVRQARSDGRL